MYKPTIFFAFLLCVLASNPLAQTKQDFQTRYGQPIEVYEIRPGILIYPKFDDAGRLVEARIQRAAGLGSTIYLDPKLPSDEIADIVNELVPQAKRGKEDELSGISLVIGGGSARTKMYKNVTIRYHSADYSPCPGLFVVVIEWKPSYYTPK